MSTGADPRIVLLLDRLALFLAALGAILRWTVHAATAGTGTNAFIHLLFWVAMALWFAGRAFAGGATWRFTGFEFAFLAFAAVSLVSVLRASYRLPAMEHALRDLSFGLLFMLAVNLLGTRTLLSLLLPTLAALSVYALLQVTVLFPRIDTTGLSVEMTRRAGTHEPWATFLGPNQLAGFLVLLLPILAGYARDANVRWPVYGAVALGLAALFLTGSTGALVALTAGIVAFAVLALTRSSGRRRAVVAGGVLGAVLLLLVLTTPLVDAMARRSMSMHVRQVYWQAAASIIKAVPLGGVGLDNFREYYFQAKPETPQETMHAHNDYLQVLAETGVFGFLAFAAILALGLRKALPAAGGPGEPRPEPARLLPAAAAAAFLTAALTNGILQDAASIAVWTVTAVAWAAARVLFRHAAPDPALPWTRIGVASGLVALLVQLGVDFEFYEPGVALTLFLALALAALLRGGHSEFRLPAPACAGAAALLSLVAGPLLLVAVPRLMASDGEMADARRGGPEAARIAEAAVRHAPWSSEARDVLAQTTFLEWTRSRAKAPVDEGARQDCMHREEVTVQAMADALQWRPRWAPLHARAAFYHHEFHRLYVELLKNPALRSSTLEGRRLDHLRRAVEHQEAAVTLYPTYAPIRFMLGRYLEEDDRAAEARDHYREALRLTEIADGELWTTDRMKLAPLERARCLVGLGQREKAVDYLRFVKRTARFATDDVDEVMRPVIEEAARDILGPGQPKGNP